MHNQDDPQHIIDNILDESTDSSDEEFFDCDVEMTTEDGVVSNDHQRIMPTASQNVSSHSQHTTNSAQASSSARRMINQTAINRDLLDSVKGMYRILDLVNESGSDGTVDKVIIAQDSLKLFINDLLPGAHVTSTKINFKALDALFIKPIGVYGSKQAIAELLISIGAASRETVRALTSTSGDMLEPFLRSGLYIVRSQVKIAGEYELFVIYWPENTTWNDNAITSVCRNRITFMRYLTKIADQVIDLISPEHAKGLVWNNNDKEDQMEVDDEDGVDRLFTFEIEQTNEQEENVTVHRGFEISSQLIAPYKSPPECPVDPETLAPRLIEGETVLGLLTAEYIPHTYKTTSISDSYNEVRLRSLLKDGVINLNPQLGHDAISILVKDVLKSRFPKECKTWEKQHSEIKTAEKNAKQKRIADAKAEREPELTVTNETLTRVIAKNVLDMYPSLTFEGIDVEMPEDSHTAHSKQLEDLPGFADEFTHALHGDHFKKIANNDFQQLKERILCSYHLLKGVEIGENDRKELIYQILHEGNVGKAFDTLRPSANDQPDKPKSMLKKWWSFFGSVSSADQAKKELRSLASKESDANFLSSISDIVNGEPVLAEAATDAYKLAQVYLNGRIKKLSNTLANKVSHMQERFFDSEITRELDADTKEKQKAANLDLIEKIRNTETAKSSSLQTTIETLKGNHCSLRSSYSVTGSQRKPVEPAIRYKVTILELSSDDKEQLRTKSTHVPSPHLEPKRSHSFQVLLNYKLICIRLLAGNRCLLILEDTQGNVLFYCDELSNIDNAIANRRSRKQLNRDKIGQDYLVAFDESKRMLAVCSSTKLQLNIFIFNEMFTSLNALGTTFNLASWYPVATSICFMCFVYGNDEVLLIDTSRQARIFSIITQHFRPASLILQQVPLQIHSSPDGSCLFTQYQNDTEYHLTAYHWSTFGSAEGISMPMRLPVGKTVISSLVKRNNVHLVVLDVRSHKCQSLAFDITSRITQFAFTERGSNPSLENRRNTCLKGHNCLIDCHADVWTRFPVQPAIQRQTITGSSKRVPKSLTFITDRDHDNFKPHFSKLISTFERTTKKPTSVELKNIVVQALGFRQAIIELTSNHNWFVSCFKAGEWLVDILCLIPIQIAITRENRFIPLKDGVYSPEFEKSLLGADVNTIVNNLSFGWYESIFQSYMATKPVKVVSSMGEQSVGKSYTLNHLVDTSFAGSAMRTTEGVWMSVAPTEDCLVVALDFEGVDSLERSVQEDTFLVLFNTAISNLVLFRNNFVFSRDIKGLFHSFQSSSTVLNPAANPTLFQSTLVIIIKDVVDSDKIEIKREFQSKFQQIVQEEQDENFITRLHRGKLNIIPWPVIESPQFYALFPVLKRCLYAQKSTHTSAGAFLYTLKTLMAKLKANDWGALSQTLTAHRAQCLLDQLPNALAFGLSEIEPEVEPLKNLDTDMTLDVPDTASRFHIAEADSQQETQESKLAVLIDSWDQHQARHHVGEDQWIAQLTAYLSQLVDMRIEHVKEWMLSNLSRFKAEHANIEALRRAFESGVVDLRANIIICKLQCQSCHLSCLQSRHHEGQHNCRTDHKCSQPCDFFTDHEDEQVQCGFSAGHSGKHICVVNTHLCGESCMFSGRPGCLESCTKMINHTDISHTCSSTIHACGEPCDLKNAAIADYQEYTCSGTCAISIQDAHDRHRCHERLCPITCQLCRRLCSEQDHLHGLDDGAVHLCGQQHACKALCAEEGTCEIETAPHSIEATFTGRHETFQYTKYTQVAKRLPCAIPIDPGNISHQGPHRHGEEENSFHFCISRCESCGYFCTLPLGHAQPTHETSHGSMSKTQWAVDGPDGTIVELNNRKFGTDDDGAPMMCNIICQTMGRHVHIDYCRATEDATCRSAEIQHINTRMSPYPERPKDFLTHNLFWRRTGFKDPYSREDQATFSKCDAMCPGQEHTGTPANPSYCTLPLFHAPRPLSQPPNSGMGYLSNDGHSFPCKNPAQLQQSFHVIFVIDRSSSMSSQDRYPLQNTPVTARIAAQCNNRLGAVYSSLYAFWSSRQNVLNQSSSQQSSLRRDAYSVLLFDHEVIQCIANDFRMSADELLNTVLRHTPQGGTNYTSALKTAQSVMTVHWSPERTPVIIFLSDGECSVMDQTVQDVCRAAVGLGGRLSLQSVSFGPQASSTYLRRMAQIALEFQNNAPPDPLRPASSVVLSSYSQALDTVRLVETFLGIAEALVKPRGALVRRLD